MSYSLLQLVQKFNSLQSQVNNVVGNLKKFTSLDNFNSLKFQINNTVTNLQNLILNNPFITITNPNLNFSIFESNPNVILKINNGIDNIVIPAEMIEGQSIQFYNLSSNSVTIISFVLAYNTFYSPKGTKNYTMSPYSVFTFHLVSDSDSNKLFIVN